MKKSLSLLLCIVLISCLVSCDINAIWDNIRGETESTTTTQPIYDIVMLNELFHQNQVTKIQVNFGVNDDDFSRFVKNINLFYSNLLNNVELTNNQFAIDKQETDFFEFWQTKKKENPWFDHTPYSIIFYGDNNTLLGYISVCANNTAVVYVSDKGNYEIYVTISDDAISQEQVYTLWELEE